MNTAQDIVYFLLSGAGGGAQDGEHATIRQAVIHGVREVMQCRNWLWHTQTGSFTTQQITTTAAITAGSSTMTVADTSGFIPGRMVDISAEFFSNPVRIQSVSGNTVTVDTPASQSGSSVTVRPQVYYDLPADLRDIDSLVTNTVGTLHCQISPQEWQRLEINTRGAGEPYYYTIMRSDNYPDRYQVRFVGVPASGTVVNYTYRRRPAQIKYMGYERLARQGTVSLALVGDSNVPTVTGVGTAFPQDAIGCYIRFGAPGADADPVGATIPFVMERRVEKWLSATSLIVSGESINNRTGIYGPTLADEYDGGVVGMPMPTTSVYADPTATLPSNTKYAITDVIDASPQMYTAILSACEMWYARMAGKPFNEAMVVFTRDLRLAMEFDNVSPLSGRPTSSQYSTARSAGWYSQLQPDVT